MASDEQSGLRNKSESCPPDFEDPQTRSAKGCELPRSRSARLGTWSSDDSTASSTSSWQATLRAIKSRAHSGEATTASRTQSTESVGSRFFDLRADL